MRKRKSDSPNGQATPYLSAAGAWALAYGCSVGWGSFVMPGTTFLPVAGPYGTALGIGIGGLVMLLLGANYHYLMNCFSGKGGVYTYTKKCFGYDHGFVSAWFLVLTYIAIIWANATALPLIARTLLGSTFQYGFHYTVAGFDVYLGEILLAVGALLLSAAICLRRKAAARCQIVMAVLLLGGIIICFAAAMRAPGAGPDTFSPAFAPEKGKFESVFTIFALAPWAYVGFESISHSAEEAKFPLKKSYGILAAAVLAAAVSYILLSLLAVTAVPEGVKDWSEYVEQLGKYKGIMSQPVFFSAASALGKTGSVILGIAAICAIFTGLTGNYIALSRLMRSMAEDKMLPEAFGALNRNNVPERAIISVCAVSVILPFFGRTAISWIVDVTTIGATIAYAYASGCALKTALNEKSRLYMITGAAGLAASFMFAIEFLVPNFTAVKTLSMESYFILAFWSILGLLYFRTVFRLDKDRRYGHTIIVWVIMLALIIFCSGVWMDQETDKAIDGTVEPIESYYTEKFEDAGLKEEDNPGSFMLVGVLDDVKTAHTEASIMQIALIVIALLILFDIYYQIHKREKQIEVEKALAEDASRAKTSFLSNMSHEIRTPMNAIIGIDSIALRNPDLQPQTREQLEKIGSSARHLLGLINDILDMSRIESGRMSLKNEEFSFKEFLDQINIIINGQCVDKGLRYECNVAGEVEDYYYGDDMKLKQVLINILGNAVKFTDPPGTVSFTAEQTAKQDELRTLCFTMRDTGIGMDEEYIPRLFDSFSQEDETTVNRYGGSGLGMAITKNLVEMMNGEIKVESTKGVGSVFTVTVTLKASDRTYKDDEGTIHDGVKVHEILAGRRVLMAEDVEQNAEILSDLLELEDIQAERAVNGEEAVRMFSEHPEGYYDAVLMDVRMPVMDGLTAASTIRGLNRNDAKTVPIIAMTANVFDEDVERSRQAGMNAHLFKPIDPDVLFETMANALSHSSLE